jgi:hypothetical protein
LFAHGYSFSPLVPIHLNSAHFAQNIFGDVVDNECSCGFSAIFGVLQFSRNACFGSGYAGLGISLLSRLGVSDSRDSIGAEDFLARWRWAAAGISRQVTTALTAIVFRKSPRSNFTTRHLSGTSVACNSGGLIIAHASKLALKQDFQNELSWQPIFPVAVDSI